MNREKQLLVELNFHQNLFENQTYSDFHQIYSEKQIYLVDFHQIHSDNQTYKADFFYQIHSENQTYSANFHQIHLEIRLI